jgi:type VI secretion system protein ImpK
MRDDIAGIVHPVLTYGLRLKERLERGETADFANEQAALKGLLGTESQAKANVDYGGDAPDMGMTRLGAGETTRRGSDHFLGIRYALVCWLDETFILDSPWETEWNERKLEEQLYGSNDRAWKFWEQARRAEGRSGTDALEVYYLCVVLGFRGDLRDEAEKLKGWANAAATRIGRGQGQEWPVPPEKEAPINVPPLRGRERLQTMVTVGGVLVGVLVTVLAFLLVYQFGS